MSERLRELDALRGIAAFSVVACHVLQTLPDTGGLLWRAPLANGREAVILFFVLSGFVLNLPFLKHPGGILRSYPAFLVKRFCRLYLPYFVAVCCAAAGMAYFGGKPVPGATSWINGSWQGSAWVTFRLHLDLLSWIFLNNLIQVVWSLVIEARISLVFPLLALVVNRLPWAAALGLAFALEAFGIWIDPSLTRWFGYVTDYTWTLHYLLPFTIGMLAARHREGLVARFRGLPYPARGGVLLLGLVCYYKHHWLRWVIPGGAEPFFATLGLGTLASDWRTEDPLVAFGALCFIVIALGSPVASRTLLTRPLTWLGDISYSLYLFHPIVLMTLYHAANGRLPAWLLAVAAVPLSLAVAWGSWRWVEEPAIRLGRRLTAPRKDPGEERRLAA